MAAMKNLFQPTWTSLAIVVVLITTSWSLSSMGYYQLAGFLGKPGGYNEGPRVFSLYYGVWCLIVFVIFHPALSAWAKRYSPPEDRFAPVFMPVSCALFGGFHLTLALDGANPFYVLRYTVAATLFGAITPYLMLKARNGFVYSFSLHWGWYALDTTIWRLLFPVA